MSAEAAVVSSSAAPAQPAAALPDSSLASSAPSPSVSSTSTTSYPLRDRSTLVKPDKDLPDSSAAASSSSPPTAAARKEKFFDQFLSSVSPFPAFLQSKLLSMRELDLQCVHRMRALDAASKQHIAAIHSKWREEKKSDSAAQPPSASAAAAAQDGATPSASSSSSSSASSSSSSSPVSSLSSPPVSDLASLFGHGSSYDIEAAELHLRSAQDECARLSRAKAQLASECYEAIDAHIRRLDGSLKKYETRLRRGAFDVPAAAVDRRKPPLAAAGRDPEWREMMYEGGRDMLAEVERLAAGDREAGGRRGRGAWKDDAAGSGSSRVGTAAGGAAGGLGALGADGSEPVYCTCRKLSYGQMVACDNEDCVIEWFHFACVGLDSKPRGRWLCPNCRELRGAAAATATAAAGAAGGALQPLTKKQKRDK